MSRERLLDLKEALNQKGWKIILDSENEKENDLFKVYNEGLIWRIIRSPKYGSIKLTFFMTNHLGGGYNDINHLFSCRAEGLKDSLFFSKINSPEWKEDLKIFMSELDKVY